MGCGSSTPAQTSANKSRKVLIVATSASKMGDHATGAWSEEITGPYYTFVDMGFDVTVCSIDGGDIPIDAGSLSDQFKTENDKRMIDGGSKPLKGTMKLADMNPTGYDAVFFAGGHGTCVDFPTDQVGDFVSKAAAAGKVVGAVCHGPMCLAKANGADGKPLVNGKKVCVFTDVEEEQVGLTGKVPFLLEQKMKELGADVQVSAPWSDNAIRDGNLVTGQNPQSSVSAAKLVAEALGATPPTKPVGGGRKILIVTTSASKMGDHATGAWSEEITGPYYTFVDMGFDVTVCSIDGGDIPIDAGSLSDQFKTENDKRMIDAGSKPLKGTKKLADMNPEGYDALFFAGGHGTCVDFPTDQVGEFVGKAAAAGKVVGAVCHGPMCFAQAKGADGKPLVSGKKVCVFTDVEEEQVGLTGKVPFLLEQKMKELGADVQVSAPWSDNAVRDGNLVTGQNPQSSVSVAKLVAEALA